VSGELAGRDGHACSGEEYHSWKGSFSGTIAGIRRDGDNKVVLTLTDGKIHLDLETTPAGYVPDNGCPDIPPQSSTVDGTLDGVTVDGSANDGDISLAARAAGALPDLGGFCTGDQIASVRALAAALGARAH
jgi:hypothetical protein